MKKLVVPHEFDDREEALLEAWDKLNISSSAEAQPGDEFEARLIAAHRKAEEAASRLTEAEDEAICRRMAIDASLDEDTPEPGSDTEPPSPASIPSVKSAKTAPRLSSFHVRLAAIVLASSAFGVLFVILIMRQRPPDDFELAILEAKRAPRSMPLGQDSVETSSSRHTSRIVSEVELMELKPDDACNDLDFFTHGGVRSSSSSCIRSSAGADSRMSSHRSAASAQETSNPSLTVRPADVAHMPHTPRGLTERSDSTPRAGITNNSSEKVPNSENAPSRSFPTGDAPLPPATHIDDRDRVIVAGSFDRTFPPSTQDAHDMSKKLSAKLFDEAESLNASAGYYGQSAYAKAEPLYVRALADDEERLGPNHPTIATDLNNLAVFYWQHGAHAKAEPLYLRALAIREKALGPNHPDVAVSLNNLAMLYQARGSLTEAEALYARALGIYEKALGPNHRSVAENLNNLALLYRDQGADGKAEPLFLRALAIGEIALGPNHPDIAENLNNLALLYQDQGADEKAKRLFLRALAIDEAQGPNHPNVAISMNNLAQFYAKQGAYDKAEPLLSRAAELRERQLRIGFVQLPEPRERALMALLEQDTDGVVSLHVDSMSESTAARDLALTTILRRKGRILDFLVENESRIRRNLPPGGRWLLDQLSQTRADLAAHMYPRGGPSTSADRVATDAARARLDELETRLSVTSAEFRPRAELVTLAKVRAQIPNGAALVEFAKYRRFDPKQPKRSQFREERYVAYILTAQADPQWIALGKAAPIDAKVGAVLSAIRDHAPIEATRVALQRLDALVLAPVRAKLPGISHLILAPDGQLNLVPFEALVDPQGHYVLENYLISYLTTGRDLLRIAAPRSPKSPAIIMADPDYGPPPAQRPGALSFTRLPDGQAEATDLQPYFPTAAVTGANATKPALASLTAPAIIHIATHGFYARDVPSGRPAPEVLRDMARGFYVESSAAQSSSSSRSDDLADGLDRAGLALAGANHGPDGIVTAREIAGFDWWGTQLVVLSTSEIGVGAASSGDGVYGLRRALVLAGAASQVVSMWNVENDSTRQLMRAFYGHLARSTGRAEALRQAKLALLHQPKYEHPFYWAAFIAAGDWRPLTKGILVLEKSTP